MSTSRIALSLFIALATAAALVGPASDAAALTPKEATDLVKCQQAIAISGRTFVRTKLRLFEQCGTELVNAALKCEAGLQRCDALIAEALGICARNFNQIGPASTAYVNAVIRACTPVEGLLFGGTDPLGFETLNLFIDAILSILGGEPVDLVVTNVEQLAGALCVAKEVLVDIAGFLEVPLTLNPFDLPPIPIDPRCTLEIVPVP
jgi:hypothetical protein